MLLIIDNLARGEMAIGALDRAEAHLEEGLATANANLPADNVRRGMLERSLGEFARARPAQGSDRALRLRRRVFAVSAPDHPGAGSGARIAKLQSRETQASLSRG